MVLAAQRFESLLVAPYLGSPLPLQDPPGSVGSVLVDLRTTGRLRKQVPLEREDRGLVTESGRTSLWISFTDKKDALQRTPFQKLRITDPLTLVDFTVVVPGLPVESLLQTLL